MVEFKLVEKLLYQNEEGSANNRGRPEKWYNLDAIISIGYRINSKEATQFRKWSNTILKQKKKRNVTPDFLADTVIKI